ncbi:FAD-dependent oxidoreductase [Roseateles sp. BYS180W]|uniref:FAD-dependent oxidoreductase n=1 Tax=Roseateles rivi TaxID=3299028 RepID=A0ABW7FSP3_9BURK
MPPPPSTSTALSRRHLLQASAAWLLAGCQGDPAPQLRWVGPSPERGHLLREPAQRQRLISQARQQTPRRSTVLVAGGGVAGLSCARALHSSGVDVALLELEDEAGGNARGHQLQGLPCPLGAHYLPVPDGPHGEPVRQLLAELGIARLELGRWRYDERHLCHSPQERVFHQGQWFEGLLPPPDGPAAQQQRTRFEAALQRVRGIGFAMPTHALPWRAEHAALDAQTFAHWLDQQGLTDPLLRWYLDYVCLDDYGAPAHTVSAWAGLQYFASRHGGATHSEHEAVLTWPEGNAYLTRRMAQGLSEQLHTARVVLAAEATRHGVTLLAYNTHTQSTEHWQGQALVLATPLFISERLLLNPPDALRSAAQQQQRAPWLVANLLLDGPLLERVGAPPAWDNVLAHHSALGYVNAQHQRLTPEPLRGAQLITAYQALSPARRPWLLQSAPHEALAQVLEPLLTVHPDLREQLRAAHLTRWGHAMSIPTPGLRSHPALTALQQAHGRLHFAHADLSSYSVFEEAQAQGLRAARQVRMGLG